MAAIAEPSCAQTNLVDQNGSKLNDNHILCACAHFIVIHFGPIFGCRGLLGTWNHGVYTLLLSAAMRHQSCLLRARLDIVDGSSDGPLLLRQRFEFFFRDASREDLITVDASSTKRIGGSLHGELKRRQRLVVR